MKLELVIANKNYSSWSMRPWVLMTAAGLDFAERQFWFDENDQLPKDITTVSPSGLVPCLLIDGVATWDSLAICEAVAELVPDQALWPRDSAARRLARAPEQTTTPILHVVQTSCNRCRDRERLTHR